MTVYHLLPEIPCVTIPHTVLILATVIIGNRVIRQYFRTGKAISCRR